MKILVSIASGSNNTERDILRSFYDGIEQFFFNLYKVTRQKDLKKVHNIDLRLSYDPEIEQCDIAVQFGTVKERSAEHHVTKQSIQKNARHVVYVETPLLGRVINKKNNYSYYRVGVDGFLNNDGIFYQEDKVDPSRINLLRNNGLEIKNFVNWKNNQLGNILVLLQLPGDASLRGQRHSEWFIETIEKIRKKTNRTIAVRFHPAMSDKGRAEFFSEIGDLIFKNYANIVWSNGLETSLEEEFNSTGICVSYTSGSCIDAVLAGVPVISMDEGNLAYPISSRRIDDLDSPRLATHEEIKKWLDCLANSQWNEQEMITGQVWNHLWPILEEKIENDSNSLS
jgi:hypothetical protein